MDITTEAVRAGLAIEQLRMQVAGSNIAHAGIPGAAMERADFSHALATLEQAAQSPDAAAAHRLAGIDLGTLQGGVERLDPSGGTTVSLDDQVAELNIDSVRFKTLADGLARRFAMLQIAISGK